MSLGRFGQKGLVELNVTVEEQEDQTDENDQQNNDGIVVTGLGVAGTVGTTGAVTMVAVGKDGHFIGGTGQSTAFHQFQVQEHHGLRQLVWVMDPGTNPMEQGPGHVGVFRCTHVILCKA